MRIIGGQWKGRRIQLPSKKWPVRPTTDFAREALFNILDNRVVYEEIKSLDLFGGTGIHSIELASRGCTDITYVERFRESCRFMRSIVKEWDMSIKVVQSDVLNFIHNTTELWDYIFADPPYDMVGIEEFPFEVMRAGILKPSGFFVLEHSVIKSFAQKPGFMESRQYGQSVFSFFTSGS